MVASATMNESRAALHRLRNLPAPVLDEVCRAHGVRVLTAFGSAVGDEAQPGDLDLGVVFEPGRPHDLHRLLEALVDLLGTERIDLLDAPRASETARMRAIGEGEALYESEPTAFAIAAAAAMVLYWETAPMRAAALEELIG